MNIYGDTGNRIVLEKRLKWRGIPAEVVLVSSGDALPEDSDIVIGGGGQDASQSGIATDLLSKKDTLQKLVDRGCVMLMVCGMYQLLGKQFITNTGEAIEGLGIFNLETRAEPGRIIGNVTVWVEGVGQIVGYENHSGRTYLESTAIAFAKVVRGKGNNDSGTNEGCRLNNLFGTYMHGPILSKNPLFADLLLQLALRKNGLSDKLTELDDTLEQKAHDTALSRPR
jgi:CobQ-like glutamine amidotransferase family enzyme